MKPLSNPSSIREKSQPRGERWKLQTRSRLLEAALQLMAEKGLDGVAINEITEAADVGFGSFYNHFKSKEAIYAEIVDSLFVDFAVWLDGVSTNVADPAEVIAMAVRHVVLRAQREPVWGRLLIREGLSAAAVERGLGQRLLRDLNTGIKSGRFSNSDAFMCFIAVSGTVIAAINAAVNGAALGYSTEDWPQRTAYAVLRTLGLDRKTAEDISKRPLPQ